MKPGMPQIRSQDTEVTSRSAEFVDVSYAFSVAESGQARMHFHVHQLGLPATEESQLHTIVPLAADQHKQLDTLYTCRFPSVRLPYNHTNR